MSQEGDPGLTVEIVSLARIVEDRIPPGYRGGFAYTIRINNFSGRAVTLTSRKWMIRQSDGSLETVEGDGVVGEQPLIPNGGRHIYTSYCLLLGDSGSMWGYYFGHYEDGEPALWRIPKFEMMLNP